MFSGIVQEIGKVVKMEGENLTIESEFISKNSQISESISVSAACLTISNFEDNIFSVNVGHDTLSRTNLGSWKITEKERVRASAERLGIDTAGMNTKEIRNAMLDQLSKEWTIMSSTLCHNFDIVSFFHD